MRYIILTYCVYLEDVENVTENIEDKMPEQNILATKGTDLPEDRSDTTKPGVNTYDSQYQITYIWCWYSNYFDTFIGLAVPPDVSTARQEYKSKLYSTIQLKFSINTS